MEKSVLDLVTAWLMIFGAPVLINIAAAIWVYFPTRRR